MCFMDKNILFYFFLAATLFSCVFFFITNEETFKQGPFEINQFFCLNNQPRWAA